MHPGSLSEAGVAEEDPELGLVLVPGASRSEIPQPVLEEARRLP
jgi:hypothetical protein